MITNINEWKIYLNESKFKLSENLKQWLIEFTKTTKNINRFDPPEEIYDYIKNTTEYNKPLYRRTSINRDPAFHQEIGDVVTYPPVSCSKSQEYVDNFIYSEDNNYINYELKITFLPNIKCIHVDELSSYKEQEESIILGDFIIVDKIIKDGFPCELLLKQVNSTPNNYKHIPLHKYKEKINNCIPIDLIKAKNNSAINSFDMNTSKINKEKELIKNQESIKNDDKILIDFIISNWEKGSKRVINNNEILRLKNKNITFDNNPEYFKALLSKRTYQYINHDFRNKYGLDIDINKFINITKEQNLTIKTLVKHGINEFTPINFE